jgi:hypothetical protein
VAAFRQHQTEGLSFIESVRCVRQEFDLSIRDAKELGVVAMGWADSLDEHQASLVSELEALMGLERGPHPETLRSIDDGSG